MYTVLTYFVSLIVMVVSVFITLVFKNELERMFGEKEDVFPFHICNVLITLMVSFGANAVMSIYIIGNESNLLLQFVILLLMILPIYIFGHLAFEKYKSVYRKYIPTENRKVVVLNEKYLKKKRLPSKLKNYNAISKGK
ncbi:hypothetical protein BABA_25076 [Neobacillus bataviensis LMG 21833]|uniref:Uncharacterized protein n=1 Tax=Neobacillus bataviensis LMG 21833 TaxID=1117379 RepID=K6BUS5_9BACI|nr:hypothetical protein [Neobacillus bataviensis]EKN62670.1 hypothetical protein BABA_25076 [Neobacillus bataviensis LMG 21833]